MAVDSICVNGSVSKFYWEFMAPPKKVSQLRAACDDAAEKLAVGPRIITHISHLPTRIKKVA
jgi:hypothetical protein